MPLADRWSLAPGACPEDLDGRPCVRPDGHYPMHNNGRGVSWWPWDEAEEALDALAWPGGDDVDTDDDG